MSQRSNRALQALAAPAVATLALVAHSALAAVPAAPAALPEPVAPASASQVARGAYLVKIMACNDCHTPYRMGPRGPEPDMSRMLSGHPQDMVMPPPPELGAGPWLWAGAATNTAFAGPWGVSFAANLTPDRETGLGSWTESTFLAALRSGRHEGQGRPILPPMPYPMYRQATDEDLKAIFAFLRTLPAQSNRVPQPIDPPQSH